MTAPSSYEVIQVLHSGTSTSVVRAIGADKKMYIIKENSRAVASQKKIQKYFREYTIGSSIKSKNVVKYVDMKRFGYGFAIVQEDIGGSSIKQQLPSSGFPLYQFFPMAIEIVHGIADIHAAGVVHRDINPNNIVVNLFLDSLNSIFSISPSSTITPSPPSTITPSPPSSPSSSLSSSSSTNLSSSSSSTSFTSSASSISSSSSSSSSPSPSLYISDPSSPHLSISTTTTTTATTATTTTTTTPSNNPSIVPIVFPSTPFQVRVNIVDFDIASRLSKEEITASGSHQMQGTLLYMAPEQTGRMNRHIDYRSDFYSLGATMYEMLIGKPPFRHTIDPLELMHKHIAITPKPLHEVKSEIPKALSDVVRKLMAKNAEDRYQDCAGILADLEEIQERIKNNETLDNFIVGSHDAPHHFQVSQKLYGRGEQTDILTKNFNNISNGQTAIMMMLVHGYSGVGKTTLINEVHKPLVRDKGYYVYGKFNQYSGNVPYAAFIQALRQLMQQILSESEQKLAKWKDILLKAVGKNGQIIIDVIPEFEFIIDKQQPVTKLSAVDAQNRFKQVFMSFISSIATKNHPLVIFLDDLQWADTNTLTMLTTLLTPPVSTHHLLILGAYRENEVSVDHPFVCTVADIISKEGIIQDLVLKPLELQDVESLIHDSCFVANQSSEQSDNIKYFEDIHSQENALAKEIYAKTEGNPFFINQLMTMLYQDNHIILKATPVPHWICYIEHVKAANYTNNVIDLMVTKLRKTPAVQNVLGIAAQIGNQFDLPLLAGVCGLSIKDTLSLLEVPIQENFIVGIDKSVDFVFDTEVNGNLILTAPEDMIAQFGDKQEPDSTKKSDGDVQLTKFRFGHDRIQQAAASLVGPKDITQIHLQVAEQLIVRFQEFPKKLDDVTLFLVNHLNEGLDIETLLEPQPSAHYLPLTSFSVARLNLHAAVKSKNSIAYSQALIYANRGIEILSKWSDISWQECYELTFELYSLKAELLSLLGNYEKAEEMYPTLLQQARSNKDTNAVYLIMYYQYELQTRYDDVLQVARKGLSLFGISLPDLTDKEGLEEVYAADVKAIQLLAPTHMDVETLRELPFCSDETSLSVMKLLQAIFLSAYVSGLHALAACVCSRLVVLSIEKGVCEETMMGFAGFGFSVGPYTKDYKYGFKFGKLGILLSDAHYPQTIMRGHVYILFAMYNQWCEPINNTPNILITAYELSQQTSDLNWAVYAVPYLIEYYFFQGAPLEEAVRVFNKYTPFVKNLNPLWYHYIRGGTQPIRDLIGDPSHFLEGKPFENSEFHQHTWLTVTYYYSKTLSLYYMQQKQDWLTYADQAIVMVPKLFPALYKELEIKVIVPLIYLDWLSRSSLARELYGSNKRTTQIPSPKFHVDTSDVEVEQLLPEDKQIERLNFRLSAIRDCIVQLEHLALSCECNYLHKLLLLRAECARISIMLGSTAIFNNGSGGHKQDFEEAVELYEAAIQSARTYGFIQYEVLGLELFGLFWLTAPTRSKDHVACGYLVEAVFACERWGAHAKAQRIRTIYAPVLTSGGQFGVSGPKFNKHKSVFNSNNTFSADLETVVQASQAIAKEVEITQLIAKMTKVIVETSGAQKATLFIHEEESNKLVISGECSNKPLKTDSPSDKAEDIISGEDGDVYLVVHTNGKDIEEWVGPHSLFNYTRRTLKSSILSSAIDDHQFCEDPYISENKVKSILCMPIMVKNNLKGILYLENNHYVGLFTKHRMDLLLVLTSQLAISLENTRFFNTKMKEQIAKLRLEQLTHDEERQRLRADAAEKYRLQLENFVDMICHEIRNPLNGIFGNSDLIAHYLECIEAMLVNLKQERNNDEIALRYEQELRGYLEHIKVSAGSIQVCAEHQKCITDDVLQLSKLRANKLGLSNHFFLPADLLNTVVRMFGVQAARKGLNIVQALPEGKYENMQVWADSLRIKQIITNLLSNAIKFTHKGQVKISLIIDEDVAQERARIAQHNADEVMGGEEAWISNYENDNNSSNEDGTSGELKRATSGDINKTAISPQKEKGEVCGVPVKSCYLKITIEDTGIGMTPDELSRIFTRFSQANNRTAKEYGGSGLGLAICKLLAKQMGGNLYVESIKDVGSTFYLSIFCEHPITEIQSPTINQSTIQSPKTKPPSTASVLVVEDNLMNQMLLSRILKIKGYTVHVANNGLEGLELYQQYALNPASSPFVTPTPSPSPSPKSSHVSLTTSPFPFPSVLSNFVTNSASLPSASPPQRPKLPDSPVILNPIPLPANSKIFSTVQITSSNPSSPAEPPSPLSPITTQSTQNTNKQEQRKGSACPPNTPFEFILMDMQMPIMDGLEATSRIRAFEQQHKLRPSTIIGLSGNARSEHRDNALAAGMDHYITKPYHKEVLFSLLQ